MVRVVVERTVIVTGRRSEWVMVVMSGWVMVVISGWVMVMRVVRGVGGR